MNHEGARWEMQTFRASDGLAIAYALDDYTDPWKPADTLILIHAAMGSSKRFYAWVPHLARDVRVVRIDMRGHGQTEAPSPAQLDQDRLVTDIVELADHVGARTFHVAGSSAGAIVAEKVAIDHPERVLSLAAFAGIRFKPTSTRSARSIARWSGMDYGGAGCATPRGCGRRTPSGR